MVFSSVPAYLDPPNWNEHQHQPHQQQQQAHQGKLPSGTGGGGGGGVDAHAHHHQLSPMPPPARGGGLMAPRLDMAAVVAVSGGSTGDGGGSTGSGSAIRPGSMTERARLAKIPQPEPGLKCPRCESTNTKFCYFNNYSLSQPRHFCKTCRRYWTRGGALRNVPVGGGCRRNKRTKSSKSNSSSATSASGTSGMSSSTSSTATGGNIAASIIPPHQGQGEQLSFLASLHHPFAGGDHYSTGASRLVFPGLSSLDPVDYHQFSASVGAVAAGLDQWRLQQIQQFPFLSGRPDAVQPPMSGIYPFDVEGHGGEGSGLAGHMLGDSKVPGSAGLITQLASVKMEDNPTSTVMASSSPREFLGLPGNLQFWDGGGSNGGASGNNGAGTGNAGSAGGGAIPPGGNWMDLSGFNSSSSGNVR